MCDILGHFGTFRSWGELPGRGVSFGTPHLYLPPSDGGKRDGWATYFCVAYCCKVLHFVAGAAPRERCVIRDPPICIFPPRTEGRGDGWATYICVAYCCKVLHFHRPEGATESETPDFRWEVSLNSIIRTIVLLVKGEVRRVPSSLSTNGTGDRSAVAGAQGRSPDQSAARVHGQRRYEGVLRDA